MRNVVARFLNAIAGRGAAAPVDAAAEADFVRVARRYAQMTGVTYRAWIALGVDPATLARANIGPVETRVRREL